MFQELLRIFAVLLGTTGTVLISALVIQRFGWWAVPLIGIAIGLTFRLWVWAIEHS
jgi:hypothetical protein